MDETKTNPLAGKLGAKHFVGIGKSDVPRIVSLKLTQLSPNPHQPRKTFSKTGLKELAGSIDKHSLISPIAVQKAESGEGYIIAAGERRFRAHQMLGRDTITAIITTGDPQELAVIENLQRENLKPLEEAEAYRSLKERFEYTDKDVAEAIGKNRTTVTALLSLNKLPTKIKAECATSHTGIPRSVLIEIARVRDKPAQMKLWNTAKRGLTVKKVRDTKSGGTDKKTLSPQERMLSAGRSFLRGIKTIPAGDIITNDDQYHELLELQREIAQAVDDLKTGAKKNT